MSNRPHITKDDLADLHAAYVEATGYAVRMDAIRERDCYEFLARGFTVANLHTVARYLHKGIREKRRNLGCLKWSNLISQLDRFEEDLLEAQRVIRPRSAPVEVEKKVVTQDGVISRRDLVDPAAAAEAATAGQILPGALRKFSEQLKKGGI